MTELILYISAAGDLEPERDALARAIAEIPVDLAWRIVQSPLKEEKLDLAAIQQANIHLLLLGGDIRAPVGLEWTVAQRAGRQPVCWLKKGAGRTPAALNFIPFAAVYTRWRTFENLVDLRRQVLLLLLDYLGEHAISLHLSPAEFQVLRRWRERLADGIQAHEPPTSTTPGDAGDSGIILSNRQSLTAGGRALTPDEAGAA